MKKIVIGIHGIGNKPPSKTLRDWWLKSIEEGLQKLNYPLHEFDFELIYWADILHNTPLNPDETDSSKSEFMNEKYLPEKITGAKKATGFRQKAIDYLETYYDKVVVNGVLSLNNQKATELFIHLHMKDLESYFSENYVEINGEKKLVKEAIIDRFIDKLRKHKNKRIFLIAHSMGSIIAHDTFFEREPDIKINTLLTIGSPLAQNYILHKYKEEQNDKSIDKFRVPLQIKKHWFNLADLEDQVAVHNTLSKYYEKNIRGIGIVDQLVKNNYVYDGINNPHKSFGYLRTPEFAEILNSFLISKEDKFFKKVKESIKRIFSFQ